MRSSALIIVVLGAAVAGCATPEQKAACFPVAGWSSPTFRCAVAPAPVAEVPPEPAKPEPPPPPPPTESPKAEVRSENIELSETVQFETDSAVLLDRSKALLDEVVAALNDHPEVKKVMIEGHTDSVASTRHNKKLSEQRVASVKE
ncbi:MAG TPA: OmpA family protein, partial [Kofleriaceae bacterium]|nr:OmpA family protein [Kofleriaceae bacterium]